MNLYKELKKLGYSDGVIKELFDLFWDAGYLKPHAIAFIIKQWPIKLSIEENGEG